MNHFRDANRGGGYGLLPVILLVIDTADTLTNNASNTPDALSASTRLIGR